MSFCYACTDVTLFSKHRHQLTKAFLATRGLTQTGLAARMIASKFTNRWRYGELHAFEHPDTTPKLHSPAYHVLVSLA